MVKKCYQSFTFHYRNTVLFQNHFKRYFWQTEIYIKIFPGLCSWPLLSLQVCAPSNFLPLLGACELHSFIPLILFYHSIGIFLPSLQKKKMKESNKELLPTWMIEFEKKTLHPEMQEHIVYRCYRVSTEQQKHDGYRTLLSLMLLCDTTTGNIRLKQHFQIVLSVCASHSHTQLLQRERNVVVSVFFVHLLPANTTTNGREQKGKIIKCK